MDNQLKRYIDNIVWYIPIRKLRDSIRHYLTKIIDDNDIIKMQNNILLKNDINIIKYLNRDKQDKYISFKNESEFIKKYNEVNFSYKDKCIFYIGHSSGFFAEFNYMVLAIIYCLVHNIQFKLYSKTANFAYGVGWEEFFLPFCTQVYDDLNGIYNSRWELDKIKTNLAKSFLEVDYFTQDIFEIMRLGEFQNRYFEIESLGISGYLKEVFSKIAKEIYRFNDKTKDKISNIIYNLNLPKKYIAVHIRAGDKIKEVNLISPDSYMNMIKKYTDIKDLFISTDDYSIIEYIKKEYGDTYNIFTLENKEERGYDQLCFDKLEASIKYDKYILFFSSIEIMSKAELCFGSCTSNPSRFLSAVMPENKFIEVEGLKFYL